MTDETPVYCTSGCDACRDYARELGVPLIVRERILPRLNVHAAALSTPPPSLDPPDDEMARRLMALVADPEWTADEAAWTRVVRAIRSAALEGAPDE